MRQEICHMQRVRKKTGNKTNDTTLYRDVRSLDSNASLSLPYLSSLLFYLSSSFLPFNSNRFIN